jgi:hypothetical protein
MINAANNSWNCENDAHEFIHSLETRLNLLDNISEISIIWQRLRQQIAEEIFTIAMRRHTDTHTLISPNKSAYLKKLKSFLTNAHNIAYYSTLSNPLLTLRKPKYLFFANSRRVSDGNGAFTDIYTEPLVSELPMNETMSIEEPWEFKHRNPTSNLNIKHGDFLSLIAYLCGLIQIKRLSPKTKKALIDIENEIVSRFGFHIDIEKKAFRTLAKRNGTIFVYKILFSWLKPKIIFYVSLNTDLAIVEAAHSTKIPIVELQHGVLGLSTQYPTKANVSSFPDYYFVFGKYWRELANMPISTGRIIPIGFPYLAEAVNRFKDNVKQDQVVFISQGSVDLVRSAIILANSFRRPKHIVFKLKPSEFLNWKAIYPELLIASVNNLLRVIENEQCQVHEVLSTSKYQVGISSMLLYEGLAFGCRTIILKADGYNHMENLVAINLAAYGEINAFIDLERAPLVPHDISKIFKPNWKLNFSDALKLINGVGSAEQLL